MPVLLPFVGDTSRYSFFCPGCKCGHWFQTADNPSWNFDNNMSKPTVTPSIKMTLGNGQTCHLFLTSGQIHFCSDSHHELAGQVVPMVDWDTILKEPPVNTEPERNKQSATSETIQPPAPEAPDPLANQFREAIAYVQSKGYSHGAAERIVVQEGVRNILSGKEKDTLPSAVAPVGAPTIEPPAVELDLTDTKKCPACGIRYPLGYETCPHCNQRLVAG